MSKLPYAPLVLALIAPNLAWAVDENNEFRTVGIGAQPCGEYLKARDREPEAWAPYGTWMTGFVTANNAGQRGTYDLFGDTSADRAMQLLDGYCRDHPQHPFVYAVMQLVSKELAPRRVQQKPASAPASIPIPAPGPDVLPEPGPVR